MSYDAFTLARVQTDFGVTVQTGVNLFGHIPGRGSSRRMRARLEK